MRPMLVVPASPPVAQPVHDTFRITSPHTIPIRVQAEEHTAPRMPDFQDSYFLTHAYNDTILLSNQQYEKACRPGIEIPGLHAKNPSKRHRKWKRVYETYDFHPCKPSNVLRDGHMDEVIPLDDFDYGYQTIRYKSHRKGLDGKELIVTVEVPSETPYITCIRDGEQTEGDVYRNPDGSLSLIPGRTIRVANGSRYSTRTGILTRISVRKKRKQTLGGKRG